jgi:hypothetical protein
MRTKRDKTRGCCGSTESEIVALRRSWRNILPKQTAAGTTTTKTNQHRELVSQEQLRDEQCQKRKRNDTKYESLTLINLEGVGHDCNPSVAALRLYSHGRNDHSHRAGIDHPHRRNTQLEENRWEGKDYKDYEVEVHASKVEIEQSNDMLRKREAHGKRTSTVA